MSQGRFEPPDAVGFGYFFAGRVPQGTAATLTLVVRVDAPAGATVANQATVITTAQDPMSANNSASVTSHVISGTVPPDIANVESLVVTGKPYRIRITGTNFQPGVEVYIGTDMTPWANVKRKSETVLIMKKGGDLKARFPRGVAVQIRVVNPDTGSDSFAFAR